MLTMGVERNLYPLWLLSIVAFPPPFCDGGEDDDCCDKETDGLDDDFHAYLL
jgi:hypothetical protein